MNPWIRVEVDEPGSRVEGGEPVLCDYGTNNITKSNNSDHTSCWEQDW
jgi:hypothetical protein